MTERSPKMNFMKRRRKGKIVDDSENIVRNFRLRAPFCSYRPVDYREYEPFIRYPIEIDRHLEQLFVANVDAGNKNVLDPLIVDMADQAEQHLKKQQVEHLDLIHAFQYRRSGDQESFLNQLSWLNAKLSQNIADQQGIQLRLQANKFLKEESK